MKITLNTFVISDWHFGHKNVIKFADRPDNHEDIIVERCNKVVTKHDQLLFLGDLTFTNKEKTLELMNKINCKNRFMILGNHDNRSESWYEDVGFKVVPPIYKNFKDKYDNYYKVLLTHIPVLDLPDNFINIHGHVHRGTHREYDLKSNHINVSCEPLDFYPVRIGDILKVYKNRGFVNDAMNYYDETLKGENGKN